MLPPAMRLVRWWVGCGIERVKNQGQAQVLLGRHMGLAELSQSKAVYRVKPNGSENEMHKSTNGCEGTVSNIVAGKQTRCPDCKGHHTNSNWIFESELASSVWGTCMICERKGVTATRIMPDAYVFGGGGGVICCRKGTKYNGKHGGCPKHREWKKVERPRNNHESA